MLLASISRIPFTIVRRHPPTRASTDEAFRHTSHYVVRFFADPDLYEDEQGAIRLASIYKGKGCMRDPGNYRGVLIISISVKAASKNAAKRLGKHFVEVGGDDQYSKALSWVAVLSKTNSIRLTIAVQVLLILPVVLRRRSCLRFNEQERSKSSSRYSLQCQVILPRRF